LILRGSAICRSSRAAEKAESKRIDQSEFINKPAQAIRTKVSTPNLQMPELPEVEFARATAQKHFVGDVISNIVFEEQGGGPRDGQVDDIVVQTGGASMAEFKALLLNNKVLSVNRKGKQLWMELAPTSSSSTSSSSRKKSSSHFAGGSSTATTALLFHFGMTGAFLVKGEAVPSYKSFHCDDTRWPPKFCKCEIQFESGGSLAFCDPRRLGRICTRPADQVLITEPIVKLGRDPLHDGVDKDQLMSLLASKSGPIKGLLLDQEIAFCGIGNWVADEVLYTAHIHPAQPCNSIEAARVEALANAIEHICTTASRLLKEGKEFPAAWLFNFRWSKGKQEARDHFNNKITFETIGGRTSAIVLAVQKKTSTSSKVDLPTLKVAATGESTASKKRKRKAAEEEETVAKAKGAPMQSEEIVSSRKKRSMGAVKAAEEGEVQKAKRKGKGK